MPIAYHVHRVLMFLRYKVFAKLGIKRYSRYISIQDKTDDGRRVLVVMERNNSGKLDVGGGDKDTIDRLITPIYPQFASVLAKRYFQFGESE